MKLNIFSKWFLLVITEKPPKCLWLAPTPVYLDLFIWLKFFFDNVHWKYTYLVFTWLTSHLSITFNYIHLSPGCYLFSILKIKVIFQWAFQRIWLSVDFRFSWRNIVSVRSRLKDKSCQMVLELAEYIFEIKYLIKMMRAIRKHKSDKGLQIIVYKVPLNKKICININIDVKSYIHTQAYIYIYIYVFLFLNLMAYQLSWVV